MSSLEQMLQQYFGFNRFREGQEEPVQRVLNGRHTLLVMPTGAGKSLAYQLPALMLDGLTLVISPLIALMQDQVGQLTERGLPATFINSSLPGSEINHRLRAVREGHVKLLYIAPERLRSRSFTGVLSKLNIAMLAVDEAHCLSQWGHDFRPDYLHVGPIWQAMGRPTLLATTATATEQVRQDIVKLLGVAPIKSIVTGFNRANLTFRVSHAPDARTKLKTLQTVLSNQPGSAIIYCATRRNSDDVADFVQTSLKIPAAAYHAGLDKDTRYRVQTDFMADRLRVVAATNAFGMGVDKADVRLVLHYNMPASVEAYYQEAGRAGRDGQPADCLLLFGPDDQRLQHRLITGDTPSLDDLHQIYTRLAQATQGDEAYVAAPELAQITGLHPIQVRVALSELEQAGLIYHLGDEGGYGRWKVHPLDNQVLRQRAQAIERRARIRLDMLRQMLTYVQLTTCRRHFLLNYFGDTAPPKSPRCCDNHGDSSVDELPKATTPEEWFPLIILETVRSLHERPVGRKRLAQLLNGSRAKGIAQFGYDRHKFYGKLSMLSQPQITALVDALLAGRYLRLSGGELPVLLLADSGLQALNARAALLITVAGYAPPAAEESIEQWQKSSRRSDTVQETLALFEQGLTLAQICEQRGLKESTIYTHLARLIADNKVTLHQVVTPEVEVQVLAAVERVGSAFRMWPLKEILPDDISYGQIRCVIAAHPELPREDTATETTPPDKPVIVDKTQPSSVTPAPLPPRPAASSPDSPTPSPNSPDQIILNAVARLGGTLGRTGLAQFLTGSQAAWLETFRAHSAYGQLGDLSQKAVLHIIDALITDGQLVSTGGNRPKVIVPEQKLPDGSDAAGEAQSSPAPRSPAPQPASESPSPQDTILAVVADLDGLLTSDSLVALLAAGPDEIVSFSDHPSCGAFHGKLTESDIAPVVQQLVQAGRLVINQHRRLELAG
jgi:ATP-dependent DNA helicase RecQ